MLGGSHHAASHSDGVDEVEEKGGGSELEG